MLELWNQDRLNRSMKVANELDYSDRMKAGGAAIRARMKELEMEVNDVIAASGGELGKSWLYNMMNGFVKEPPFFKLVLLGRISRMGAKRTC